MSLDDRLRRDLALFAGDPEAAALLACLAGHVLDPAHDLGSMLRICGASRGVQDRVVAKLGPLKDWVTDLRLDEGERLVRETRLPVQKLCRKAGYPNRRSFRRAFGQRYGESPHAMRRRLRRERARAELAAAGQPGPGGPRAGGPRADGPRAEGPRADGPRADPAADAQLHPGALSALLRRRTDLGLLGEGRVAGLRRRLRRHHRDLDTASSATASSATASSATASSATASSATASGDAAPGATAPAHEEHPIVLTPAGDRVEELAVNAILGQLIDAPEDEARFILGHAVLFGNVPAYRHLQHCCLQLIPHRPERALLLAELSVQMIERHRMLMGDEGDQWQADAWVSLARVQAYLGHTGDADQSLAFACAEVGGAGALEPWVEIELRKIEGLIRHRQRRRDEAEQALERAVELGRDLPVTDPGRFEVVHRRLELASALGDAAAGEALADELEALVEARAADPRCGDHLTLGRGYVSYHRARAAAADGRDCCAHRHLLETVNGIAADPDSDTEDPLGMLYAFALHQLSRVAWRAGDLDDGETWLRSVLERYAYFNLPVLEAAAEAELAVVCALRGAWDEARRLARAAASFLDDLPFHREAWNAARRLRQLAQGDAEVTEELAELLESVRRDLDLVAWEITGSQARSAFEARRGLT